MAELPLLADDNDLVPVLAAASDEDLGPLVQYILGSDEKGRWASKLDGTHAYKKHAPQHGAYALEIAAEIQTFGGNSVANIARGGRGVSYREIVDDVAGKFGVKLDGATPVASVESAIQVAVLERAYAGMSDADKRELFETAGERVPKTLPKTIPVAILQALVAGSGFAVYKTAAIVANAVAKLLIGRGLTFVGNQTLMKAIGAFAGPIGWTVTAAWTAVDLAGPASRVTIPCVLHVAYLRQKQLVTLCPNGHQSPIGNQFCGDCGESLST